VPEVQAGKQRKNLMIPDRSKKLFCSSKRPACLWRLSFLHFKRNAGSFYGGKEI
jgi:hypothetical protein